jgi:LysR family cyn operon transcriptional activator
MPRPEQPQLKLRHLEAFLAAVKHGTFVKAAEALQISSSGLSQAIAELEGDLGEGVRLFDRGQGGARLTAHGEALVAHAERLLEDAEAARSAVRGIATTEKAHLQVAYAATLARPTIAAIQALLRQHPGLRVEANEMDAEEGLLVSDRSNLTEVAVAYLPPEDKRSERSLRYETIATSALWCVTSARHPLARLDAVPYAALEKQRLALPWRGSLGLNTSLAKTASSQCIAEYLRERRYFAGREPAFLGANLTALLELVRGGNVVTLLPTLDRKDRTGLAMLRLEPGLPTLDVGLVWRSHGEVSEFAQAFAAEIRKRVVASLQDSPQE